MEVDGATAELPQLMAHIVEVHHGFCRREMARLTLLFQAAVAEAGGQLAAVRRLQTVFQRLCSALALHLAKEEAILFPLIAQFDAAARGHTPPPQPSFGSVANPIRMMVLEHDEAAAALEEMRAGSGGFRAPAEASAGYRELCAALLAFDDDMRRHVELEDHHLFPRAIATEQAALAG